MLIMVAYLLLIVALLQSCKRGRTNAFVACLIRFCCMPPEQAFCAKQRALGLLRCWEESIKEAHSERATPELLSRRRPG